jgi:8-hydroxy-5-deazaflavin:NADPH oxidoreductase
VFNCTAGGVSLAALRLAGAENLAGKVLVDVSNPLDFSRGFPALSVCNTDSNAEQIQREFPDARVVKSLNTVNCNLMVDASRVPGDHDVFVAGDDAEAKAKVASILREDFGWRTVVDLGDLTGARPLEMHVLMWLRLYNALGTPDFNVHVVQR